MQLVDAPTALLEIIKMANEGICNPALIVGIPVGFISAVESKSNVFCNDCFIN